MQRRLSLLSLLLLLAIITPSAAQDLPGANWYAVAWLPQADTLHWLNEDGEVTSIARPKLPAEAAFPQAQMRISADGRVLMIVAALVDGTQGIGFYDLETGQFLRTHQAQPDEDILLGLDDTSQGDQIAVGFATLQTNAWRVIVFEFSSGDAIAQLTNADPIAAITPDNRTPIIVYYAPDTVHFHLTQDGVSSAESAFAWNPVDGALSPSPYINLNGDILASTGEQTFPTENGTFDLVASPLPQLVGGNAIGRGDRLNPTTLYADSDTFKTMPRWVAGGGWVAFQAWLADGNAFWLAVPATGDTQPRLLGEDITQVYGAPAGYLALHTDNRITYNLSFNQNDNLLILPPGAETPQIIYITPHDATFLLETVTAQTEAPAESGIIAACEGAPPARLQPGIAQVIGSVPLRLRDVPDGDLIKEMPLGSQVQIIGGPACERGFLWWQVTYTAPDGLTVTGWSAEGDNAGYYLDILPPTPVPSPTVTLSPTPTLPIGGGPFIPPTITPEMTATELP
jgi:hypothetical protein